MFMHLISIHRYIYTHIGKHICLLLMKYLFWRNEMECSHISINVIFKMHICLHIYSYIFYQKNSINMICWIHYFSLTEKVGRIHLKIFQRMFQQSNWVSEQNRLCSLNSMIIMLNRRYFLFKNEYGILKM